MTTELRAGEGYLCLSCIAEGAFRICRDCREAMIQGGRTLRCPQCRGAWSQVVKGGNEDKLAEENLRGVVDAFHRHRHPRHPCIPTDSCDSCDSCPTEGTERPQGRPVEGSGAVLEDEGTTQGAVPTRRTVVAYP